MRKTSVIDAATPVVTAFNDLTGTPTGAARSRRRVSTIEDPSGAGYFIGVDNASLGALVLRRVSNPGTTPTISGNITIAVAADCAADHRAAPGEPRRRERPSRRRRRSPDRRERDQRPAVDVRRRSASRHRQASASATRNAVRWYEIGSLTATPAVMQSGTLFTADRPAASTRATTSCRRSRRRRAAARLSVSAPQARTSSSTPASAERFSTDAAGTLRAPQLLTARERRLQPAGRSRLGSRGRRWGSARRR